MVAQEQIFWQGGGWPHQLLGGMEYPQENRVIWQYIHFLQCYIICTSHDFELVAAELMIKCCPPPPPPTPKRIWSRAVHACSLHNNKIGILKKTPGASKTKIWGHKPLKKSASSYKLVYFHKYFVAPYATLLVLWTLRYPQFTNETISKS